jgi:hypothetical protein
MKCDEQHAQLLGYSGNLTVAVVDRWADVVDEENQLD